MRRTKINPVIIVICLAAMTAITLAITFYMQSRSSQRAYGAGIRAEVVSINDVTTELRDELAADEPDAVSLLVLAGKLEMCERGTAYNDAFHSLFGKTVEAVNAYAKAARNGDAPAALELLLSDARADVTLLRSGAQFVIGELASTSNKTMNMNYFDLTSTTSSTNKKLTTVVSGE